MHEDTDNVQLDFFIIIIRKSETQLWREWLQREAIIQMN